MNEKIIPFAYSDLPAPVGAELQAATSRIRERLTQQVRDIIQIGRDFIEVKAKLRHGEFERWLDSEFHMTVRTTQRFMRAAEWAEGKSDIVSFLAPTSVYLLSAKTTPPGVHEQIVERIKRGEPAKPEMVRALIADAKFEERQVKEKERKNAERRSRKRNQARWEHQREKEEKERQRKEATAIAVVRQVAGILVNKLDEDEVNKVYSAFGNFDVTQTILREAIIEVRQSYGNNVVTFPPKPWERHQ